MTYKEITDLVKLINKTDLAELKLKDKDFELQIRTKLYQTKGGSLGTPVVQMSAPAQVAAPSPAAAVVESAPIASETPATSDSTVGLLEIKSPIVGTFYRSSSPEKGPFVKVGDTVEKGSVVCIVEAMKLFNEIESEVSGKIVKVVVEDAQPVEYDQVLFLVDPS